MPSAFSDILKIAERAIYIQEGGMSPSSKPGYRGEMVFGGWTEPQGDVTPIYLPSRARPSNWDIIDLTQGAIGLASSDFTVRVNYVLYKKWVDIKERRCPVVCYIKHDDCGRPDDPRSWLYKKIAVPSFMTGDFGDAADGAFEDGDEGPVELTATETAQFLLRVFPIAFKEVADTEILAEVVDGFYSDTGSCGGRCGGQIDACNNFYALCSANSGSPGLSSQLVISTDDKETWDSLDIATLGGVSADAMADAGSYIIVVSRNDDAHHSIRFSTADSIDPTGWTRQATGYVNNIGLYDVFALSPEEIYIAAEGGYAYRLDEPTGEPTTLTDGSIVTDDLKHVDGHSRTIVFAGDAGKVLVSENKGESLIERAITLKDGSVITGDVQSLGVQSDTTWFLAVAGALYYTEDKGLSYRQKALDSNISVINDIRFVKPIHPVVGYLTAEKNGVGTVYRTHDAGYSWHNDKPDLDGILTAQRYHFAAPCGINEVAVGGRVDVGGDGILAIGTA